MLPTLTHKHKSNLNYISIFGAASELQLGPLHHACGGDSDFPVCLQLYSSFLDSETVLCNQAEIDGTASQMYVNPILLHSRWLLLLQCANQHHSHFLG